MSAATSKQSVATCLQKNNSPKMLPDQPRTKVCYDNRLAERFGVNEAIILSRMIWSIETHKDAEDLEFFHDGTWWMYDTIPAFMKYSQLGRKQVLNVLANLRKEKIIETGHFDEQTRCNWYSVNIDALYIATQMSCPLPELIVPKGNHRSSRKGTTHSSQRGLSIVPKGDDSSFVYTKNPSNDLSNSHTDSSPQTPQGEIGIGSLGDSNPLEREKEKPIPTKSNTHQNRKIISPVVLYRRTLATHPELAELGTIALSCTWSDRNGNDGCEKGQLYRV